MKIWTTSFLFAAIIAAGSAQLAIADPISVGAPGNAAGCIPFGCRAGERYQQVYAAAAFPGVFTISAIAFPYTIDGMSNQIDPAVYEIRLSTTASGVGQLSTDLASNVGADASVVFAGPLAGEVPRGGALSFGLAVPFTFDPGAGNLLLDVVKQGGVFFGDDGIYLDYNTGMNGLSSAIWQHASTGEVFPAATGGLVTVFSGQAADPGPAPVPEPATMILFGTGLAGSMLARHRRRRGRNT